MRTRHERGGSRAQLIIITALVLATVFVALALVLNSGIYAENLSTRDTSNSEDPVEYALDAERAVGDAYRRANRADSSTASDASAEFTDVVETWANATAREGAKRGASVAFDGDPHIGWHLRQEEDRSFTPAGDTSTGSWQVAHGAQGVGAFRMDVTRTDLYDADADFDRTDEDAFHLNVTDGSDTWLLYVFRDSGNDSIVVHAGDPSTHADLGELWDSADSCHVTDSRAVVDLQDESLAGAACDALNFSDDVDGSVDIRYENPYSNSEEQINGTYQLVLNGSAAAGSTTGGEPDSFNATGGDAPTAQAVVYTASFTTEYVRSDVRYSTRDRYAVREETYAG